MNSKFFGLGAKLALCFVAVLGTLTSCYEKEDIKTVIDTSSKSVNYVISGSIANSTSLKGIENAVVTVTGPAAAGVQTTTTDAMGLFSVKYEFKTKDGASQAEIDALIKSVCGSYTVDVTANGYNNRSTQTELQFAAFDNQTIATHLDFLLKSKAIQGVAEEIVAGDTEQIITIDGASADGKGTTTDKLIVPQGAFGKDAEGKFIAKTITIERAPLVTEEEASAVRVYEGKPDGTVFEIPLEIEFSYPDALVGEGGLKVLFEKADGSWVADGQARVEKKAANLYVAYIYHFSTFKIGLPTSEGGSTEGTISYDKPIVDKKELPNIGEDSSKKYCNTANVAKEFPFVTTQQFGSAYTKSLEVVFADITDATVKNAAIYQITNFIENQVMNGVNLPSIGYQEKEDKQNVLVDAHSNLNYIEVEQVRQTYVVTMKISGKDYEVEFVEYIGYNYKANCTDYSHGHGHAHGDDLNAGGGIIDFE
ncbi:carboxypeptidase-like regulatory domain-containing protein [Bacteroides faecalis]|nr:carboxypeptidase-like regulatory domain-containing protein [Bacteroides faecalis]